MGYKVELMPSSGWNPTWGCRLKRVNKNRNVVHFYGMSGNDIITELMEVAMFTPFELHY